MSIFNEIVFNFLNKIILMYKLNDNSLFVTFVRNYINTDRISFHLSIYLNWLVPFFTHRRNITVHNLYFDYLYIGFER